VYGKIPAPPPRRPPRRRIFEMAYGLSNSGERVPMPNPRPEADMTIERGRVTFQNQNRVTFRIPEDTDRIIKELHMLRREVDRLSKLHPRKPIPEFKHSRFERIG